MSDSLRSRFLKNRFSRRQSACRKPRPQVRVEELERRELMATSLGSPVHLDFGTASSPLAPGYTRVPLVAYSATRGFGWATITGLSARDRGTGDPLTSDIHLGQDKTFRVNVTAGVYDVTVTLGDAAAPRDNVAVWAEGQRVASGLTTAAGQFVRPTFRVPVTDGQLTLRLVDGGGVNTSFAIAGLDLLLVNGTPPVANAGLDVTVNEGSTRTFAGSVSGGTAPFTYAWDFGDGGTASGSLTPTHAFADNGSYTVTLTVTDAQGLVSRDTATATVQNVAPTAVAGGPYTGGVGLPVTFAATATDPSSTDTAAGFTYAWTFGDGATSSQRTPAHAYAAAGTYTVTLRVTDKDGGTSTATTTATVTPTGGGALANVGLTTGWATFGQALPQGAAFGGLQIGSLVTQTDVKTLWPDGSIRFAIVSAAVPAAGVYPIRAGAPAVGSFAPASLGSWVWFDTGASTYFATLPAATSSGDAWLQGPLVVESRQTVIPLDGAGNPHPYLTVVIDTRSYVDGQTRLDVTIENTLDSSAATAASYTVAVGLDGDLLFARDWMTQPYLTRWRQVINVGLQASEVTPDFEPVYQARALPRYWEGVENRVDVPGGPSFEPLGPGALNPDMPSHGGREELGPYPDWAARYLVHKNPTQKAFVQAHGDLAGSWPVHVRNADGSLIRLDQRPLFWMDMPNNRGEDQPAGNLGAVGSLQPDNAHQPSLAYIPYLMTGDRYYADEMAFWANYTMLASFPPLRGGDGSQGLLWSNETRGFAWALRNLVDASAYLPDNDALKAYFQERVNNNLAWLDNNVATNTGPLGVAWHRSPFDTGDNPYFDPERRYVWQSVAQNNYLAWAVDHANKQGFAGGEAFKEQMARFNIGLLTNPATRDGAAPYYTPIGERVPAGGDTINWFTQLEQTYVGPVQYAGYYGVDARLMCIIGLELGIPGAQEAYDYLTPELMIWPRIDGIPDLALRGGWSQMPELTA